MRKTVMIFGVSSFVGSNLAEILKDEFRIVGTYHKTPVEIPGITCFPCDVLKKDYVNRLIGIIKPDFTIYAVGLSSLAECKVKPKLADALNSSGAANVCSASERQRSKFVLISSAFVHGGENLTYTEGDTPFPNTAFGNSLSSAEFYVQRSCLNYLILRCGTLYGRSYRPEHPNWFEYLERSLARGEKFSVDDSISMGFLDIQIIGRIIKQALLADITNRLIHVSSADTMTRYEFARSYARIFKFDEGLVVKAQFPFPLERKPPKDSVQSFTYRLGVGNIEEFLKTKMPSVDDSLNFTRKRLENFSEKNS